MAIHRYLDFILALEVAERDADGLTTSADARVFGSPAGEGEPLRVAIPDGLTRDVGRLDRRKLDMASIIALGTTLADLALPPAARALFVRSLDRLGPDEGLRLRLRMPPALAWLPWEYLFLPRVSGEQDATGFLALDPRLSIVRHEALPVPADVADSPHPRRLVAALSSPVADGWPPLDLAREQAVITAATTDVPALTLSVVPNATAETLLDTLGDGADLFHFAGHGVFEQSGLAVRPGAVTGKGAVVLMDADGRPAPMAADQLAVNLRGRGVRLVVLGACETAKRDEEQAWSGVAAALMTAGIPAVVAMQFRVADSAAITFARALYRGLVAGLPVDQAVSLGRLQVFNQVHAAQDGLWREWGVPVLYLRSTGDMTLTGIADAGQRQAAADELVVTAELRAEVIAQGGSYIGIEAGVLEGGTVTSNLTVGTVSGSATGVAADEISGGHVTTNADVQRIEAGGQVTGVKLGRLGAATPTPAQPPAAASPRFCGQCGAKLGDGARFCGGCGAAVTAN